MTLFVLLPLQDFGEHLHLKGLKINSLHNPNVTDLKVSLCLVL